MKNNNTVNQKDTYEVPSVEVISVDADDVITTSGFTGDDDSIKTLWNF